MSALLTAEHPGLLQTASELRQTADKTSERIAVLAGEIASLSAGWEGDAAAAAYSRIARWQGEMKQIIHVLNQISGAVLQANEIYAEADNTVAKTWTV